jgi:hypothetical protein
MFEVVYYPMCGSNLCKGVGKVAEAIAVELGVKAEDTQTKKELTGGSLVFLGSGCFTSRKRELLLEFISGNDLDGREVALFGTSGGGNGTEVKVIEEVLGPTGAVIVGRFYCKGHTSILLRQHPSKKELVKAGEFANKMKKHWEEHVSLVKNNLDE